jgi:class 3 adenylate cyclase
MEAVSTKSEAVTADHGEPGTFLIADISGYTEYLSGADLEDAPTIAHDLLSEVIGAMRPAFAVNKIEGDAVFSFAGPGLTGGDLLDVVDGTYAAFQKRLLSVHQATSCDCDACGMMPRLDLKLIAHCGRFRRQRLAGGEELVGRDVILVHRLLKNTLGFAGPASGYLLMTAACVDLLGIDTESERLRPHLEIYPHLGEVNTWVGSLQDRLEARPRWQQPPGPPLSESVRRFAQPPANLWGYLAPGRSDTCVTQRLHSVHEIIEWHPFEHLVVRVHHSAATAIFEARLEEDQGGTVVTTRWYRGRRRRNAPTWEEITAELVAATTLSLDDAEQSLVGSGHR